jgi:enoyl-CoA hydratase/carnithine racemase
MGDTVLHEPADGVATLTLNRPERRNAITPHQAVPEQLHFGPDPAAA